MKAVIVVLLLVVAVIGGIVWYNNAEAENKRKYEEAVRNLDETQESVSYELDRRLLESSVQLAETRFGQGSLYRLCHEYPPTTKEHQRKCKALDDKMARADAADKKHPW